MREINTIIIHCSASGLVHQDSVAAVRELHTSKKSKHISWGNYETFGRAWADIGYHGFVDSNGLYFDGRPVEIPGAHCYGYNRKSIGYCLSGVLPSRASIRTLVKIVAKDLELYQLKASAVFGHFEMNRHRTCPNINMDVFRSCVEKIKIFAEFGLTGGKTSN